MPVVQVLLSTYNGRPYLEAQLDSVLAQDYRDLTVLVRDDGSSDGTREILRRYAARHSNLRVIEGANIGWRDSFFELVSASSPEASHVALCDQDDVWRPDKVSRAVAELAASAPETPTLYCSRLRVVTSDLTVVRDTPLPRRGLSFLNALVECPAWGCTLVLNGAARRLVLRHRPEHAYSHDWWIYLVVSAFGEVLYDAEPTILYRRHGTNTSPYQARTASRLAASARRFVHLGGRRLVTRQASEFYRRFGHDLPEADRRAIERFLERRRSLADRLRYAWSADVYRQSRSADLALRVLLALDRL